MEKFNSWKKGAKKYTNLQAIKFLFRRMKFQTKVICDLEREGVGEGEGGIDCR